MIGHDRRLDAQRLAMTSGDAFSGSVPAFYDRYLVPVLFEPYAADLVARIVPRDKLRVLELACGTGVVTRRLRAALPDAAIVATDLSPAMLAVAERSLISSGISWQPADALALPFDDGSFDVVVCQLGVMFLPDKVLGFREARRVLAPGGQLLVNVWDSVAANPYAAAMARSMERLFPSDPPQFVAMVHGYCDTAQITADLRAAGWNEITLERVAIRGRSRSAREFATGFARGSPIFGLLADRGTDPDVFIAELTPRLIDLGGDTPFEPELGAIVISATRPG
jgi:SAM-dependent methyltransferase